jgi:hypothetical protein
MAVNKFEWLDNTGSDKYQEVESKGLENALQKQARRFLLKVAQNIKKYKVIGSGALLNESNMQTKYTEDRFIKTLEIFMLYYGSFQDRGVKGWGSSKNAPDSPYQFRTKGMDEQGRASIKKMITSGKKKVRNAGPQRVGLESKSMAKKSAIDIQVDQAVWNIKKYGIKKKPFFTEAFTEVFGEFDDDTLQEVGKYFVATLKKSNKG